MECEHKFDEELECEHKFDEEFVCIKCALETDPFTREPCIFYEERKRS